MDDLISVRTLADQLAVTDKPFSVDLVEPVRNVDDHSKPAGGLWTSSQTVPRQSAWTRWACANMDGHGQHLTVLRPDRCRVMTLDCAADCAAVAERFPARLVAHVQMVVDLLAEFSIATPVAPVVNWEALTDLCDCVHVTARAVSEASSAQLDLGPLPSFAQWDCETVLWFRPAFSVIS